MSVINVTTSPATDSTVAGERAVKRGTNAEVIQHFRRALELLQGRPETAERSKAELKVLEKLGPALQGAHGFGPPEVERTYLRARGMARLWRDQESDKRPTIFSSRSAIGSPRASIRAT